MMRLMAWCLMSLALSIAVPTFAAASAAPNDPNWMSAVSRDIAAREYHALATDRGLQAPNREQGFRTYFDARGIRVVDRVRDTDTLAELRLESWGRVEQMRSAEAGSVHHQGGRVEIRRPGIVEWFENEARGLEQGFDVHERADGNGTLNFLLGVGAAKLSSADDGVTLQRGDQQLHYRGLKAWDADGVVLASTMAVVENRIELRVDDRAARYPITIDPVLTGVYDARLQSNQASGQLGHSVTYAGDLNGDGFGDIAVGAYGYDGGATNSGAVFVYFGSAGAFNTTEDGLLTLNTADARFGGSVAAAGDLNGDGFGDLIVGAAPYANGQANEGAAFVFFGGAGASFNTTADGVLENNQAGAFMGGSVAGVGDVNGDGFSDVAVGAAAWDGTPNGNEGRVFVYYGAAGASFDTTADVTLFSSQVGAAFGSGVSGGDINADGFSDIIVGSILYDNGQTDEGNAFAYFGSAAFDFVTDGTLQLNLAGAQLGNSVSVVGDVNGDGYADVLVGAPGYVNGEAGEGAAVLWLGGAGASINTVVDGVFEGNQIGAGMGRSVGYAGDINGDGYADILVGADSYDTALVDSGAAFLFLGGAGVFDIIPDAQLEPGQATVRMGFSVSGGDVNRDGYADVLVGAPSSSIAAAEDGAAFLYFGGARALDAASDGIVSSAQGSGQAGHSVATGDVNGDGFSDLIVGAFGYDQGASTNSGTVFVYFGSTGPFNNVADAQLLLAAPGQVDARFGASVAAGDINADGFDDIVVGAPEWDGGQLSEGSVYVFNGSAGAFDTTADAQIESNQVGAEFGTSVAVVGDVNGDGYNDVAIGAVFFDNGNTDEGAVRVYLGGASFDTVADGQLEADQNSAYFGTSVAGAGDVNGDGFADIVAGGIGFDAPGASNSGVVQLYFGGPGNAFNSVVDATMTSTGGARLGSSVAAAGDVNGDGYGDLIVGAFEWTGGQATEGAAFLYFGGAGAFNTTADATFEANQAAAGLGSSVAGGADINGDGFSDIVVGAHQYDNGQADEGVAFVYFGGVTVNTVADALLEPQQATSRMGFSATLGDINGDGFADAVVGAPAMDSLGVDDGTAMLFFGNTHGRMVTADQFNASLTPVSNWGLSGSADGYAVAMDVTSPRGRERGRIEVETCPSTRAFGAPQCTRFLSSGWIDLGLAGAAQDAQVTGLDLNSVHHWRARAQYLPFTAASAGIVAPPQPMVGTWRRMESMADVANVRISDFLFGNGFE
jgi:FG-GAP repeat/FG-GAP-like repeat